MVNSIIVAMARNRAIGKDGKLPWRLPADLKRFRELTLRKPIIMGRKTFESIGRPLPKRLNIMVTRKSDFYPPGVCVVSSMRSAFELFPPSEPEVFFIGGAEIYRQVLEADMVDRIYVTLIDQDFEGDVYFPEIDVNKWREIKREVGPKDAANPYDYCFVTYDKYPWSCCE